jgi:hypothetical protein
LYREFCRAQRGDLHCAARARNAGVISMSLQRQCHERARAIAACIVPRSRGKTACRINSAVPDR